MIGLNVERWNTLGAREQEAAARVVGDMLLAAGLPLEFSGLQTGAPWQPRRRRKRSLMKAKNEAIVSSGNVFEDLDVFAPEEALEG